MASTFHQKLITFRLKRRRSKKEVQKKMKKMKNLTWMSQLTLRVKAKAQRKRTSAPARYPWMYQSSQLLQCVLSVMVGLE